MPASPSPHEISADALARLDLALATIQEVLAPFSRLTVGDDPQRLLFEMDAVEEAFCRQTFVVLAENREALQSLYCLESVEWGLRTFDALRLRMLRLGELADEGEATVAVLADGLVDAAIQGYGLLKLVGKPDSVRRLQVLRETISRSAPDSPPVDEPED